MKKVSALIFLCIILIVGSLLFFNSKGAFSSVDSGLGRFFSPATTVFTHYTAGIKSFFDSLGDISSLQKENKDLKSEVNKLEAKIAQLSAQAKESDALKSELGFKQSGKYETITAEVAFFDPSNIRETILINKGQKDGISPKMAVVSQGILIGRVTDVYVNTARILLVNDPMSSIPALIEGTNTLGLVQGQLGIGIIMNQIPVEEEIKEGQVVVTSGLGGDFPKGLVVGRVEHIEKKNNSIFQTASIRSLVDLRALERVQVIIK